MKKTFRQFISAFVLITFSLQGISLPAAFGQTSLPAAASLVALTPAFNPAVLRGLRVDPQNPFHFDFVLDNGQSKLAGEELKIEGTKLIKYFLASLTLPENDLWVNLSPYEKDRIITNEFGQTEMGRELLSEDYLLKKLSSSLLHPDSDSGKKFWDKIRKITAQKLGATDIPMQTFNRIWIMPSKAVVYQDKGTAFIGETHLKVLLEEDYKALTESKSATPSLATQDLSTKIFRDEVLPIIEKEVNEGENFAPLRQIYHSLILASWYKRTLKQSLLGQIYVDQKKMAGVESDDKNAKQKIYEQYLETFKKGVYNLIREEQDAATGEMIPRKYFSGGVNLTGFVSSPDILDLQPLTAASPIKTGDLLDLDTTAQGFIPSAASSSAVKPIVQKISTSAGEMTVSLKVVDSQVPTGNQRGEIFSSEVYQLMNIIGRLVDHEFSSKIGTPNNQNILLEILAVTEIDRIFLVTWGPRKYVIKIVKSGLANYLYNEWEILTHLNSSEYPRTDIVKPIIVGQELSEAKGGTGVPHKVPYIVTEYLEGEDLSERIRLKPFSIADVIDLGIGLSDAVGYIHGKEVIVRDLKPNNIRFLKDGGIALFDFNASIPQDYDWEEDRYSLRWLEISDWNAEDRRVPLEKRKKPDQMSDIFSVGMTLLRAAIPVFYWGENINIDEALSDVEKLNPELKKIIAKAIGPRDNRYQNTIELREALVALKRALPAVPTASSPLTDEQITTFLTPYFRPYSLNHAVDVYKILQDEKYLGTAALQTANDKAHRSFIEGLRQFLNLPNLVQKLEDLQKENLLDVATLREALIKNPHAFASAFARIGDHFTAFHTTMRKLEEQGFPLSLLRKYFIDQPEAFVNKVVKLSRMNLVLQSEMINFMKGSGDFNALLKSSNAKLILDVEEVVTLAAAENFLTMFKIDRSQVIIRYSDARDLRRTAVEKRFPGYQIENASFYSKSGVVVNFQENLEVPTESTSMFAPRLLVPMKTFKYAFPDAVSPGEVQAMRAVMEIENRKVIVTSLLLKRDRTELKRILDAQAQFEAADRPLLILGLREVDDEVRAFIRSYYPNPDKVLERDENDRIASGAFNGQAQKKSMSKGDVIILNTQGELAKLYAVADLVVTGEDRNIAEAMSQGKFAIYLDGTWFNNQDILNFFGTAGAVKLAEDNLYPQIEYFFNNPTETARLNQLALQAMQQFREQIAAAAYFNTASELAATIKSRPQFASSALSKLKVIQMEQELSAEQITAISAQYGEPFGGITRPSLNEISTIIVTPEQILAKFEFIAMSPKVFLAPELSFKPDLDGAEVMILGPGYSANEIISFLQAYPGKIKALHIVDASGNIMRQMDAQLEVYKQQGNILPPVYGYVTNIMALSGKLAGKIDVVFEHNVLDKAFSGVAISQMASQIQTVLKPGGVFLSAGMYAPNVRDMFDQNVMDAHYISGDKTVYSFGFAVKTRAVSSAVGPTDKRLSEVTPINHTPSLLIKERAQIPFLVEEPLRKAVERLYDLNIQTDQSSANWQTLFRGVWISMDYDGLSAANKDWVHKNLGKGFTIKRFADDPDPFVFFDDYVMLHIDVDENTPVSEIESKSLALVAGFQKQPMQFKFSMITSDALKKWASGKEWFSGENESEAARRYFKVHESLLAEGQSDPLPVYDSENQIYYASQELMDKAKASSSASDVGGTSSSAVGEDSIYGFDDNVGVPASPERRAFLMKTVGLATTLILPWLTDAADAQVKSTIKDPVQRTNLFIELNNKISPLTDEDRPTFNTAMEILSRSLSPALKKKFEEMFHRKSGEPLQVKFGKVSSENRPKVAELFTKLGITDDPFVTSFRAGVFTRKSDGPGAKYTFIIDESEIKGSASFLRIMAHELIGHILMDETQGLLAANESEIRAYKMDIEFMTVLNKNLEKVKSFLLNLVPVLGMARVNAFIRDLSPKSIQYEIDESKKLIKQYEARQTKPLKTSGVANGAVSSAEGNTVDTQVAGSATLTPGGIDLREKNLNLDLRGEAGTFTMPTDPAQIQNIHIDGLVPVITNVTPLPSLPAFLNFSQVDRPKLAEVSLK